jgi:DMSO/TMAO reductase YedYZ molybdopterin-dependent catalytic subunit
LQTYQRSLTLEEAMREDVLLVYAMNGAPLPPQHGFPLRLLVPGWYGMTSVKWLTRIDVVEQPLAGYQMIRSYRYSQSADDVGDPVTLMKPRALMVPPGVPDFASRVRVVSAGQVTLRGRAWAGRSAIARIEVSTDGGETWRDGELDRFPVSNLAWYSWHAEWQAVPGKALLCVRATAADGTTQPFEPSWTFQGMGNNGIHIVEVLVV